MKRLFLFCAALLLQVVLFSCKEEADTTDTARNAVGFSASSVDDASRAAELNLGGLKTSGFYVNAYSTDLVDWATANGTATPGLMYNQLVEWKTSPDRWEYSPTKYWPGKVDGTNFGMVSFFAWSDNAGASVSNKDATGTPKLTVTVPNIQSGQSDLVTGVAVDKTVNSGAVKFAFKHVLSRIGFKAKLDKQYPNTTVKIKSLKVKYKTGAVESKGVYTFGDADGAEGTWASSSPKAYMSNADAAGDEVVVDPTNGVPLNNEATPTATRVNGDANYLMLLPQGDVEDGDMTVDVAWTVETADGNVAGGKTVISNVHTVSLLKPNDQKKWELGKSYYYELNVSLTAVTFGDVSVEDWGTPTTLTLCELTYDANNGTGDVVNKTLFTNREYKLLDESMFAAPAADLTFVGWNTRKDGKGDDYWPGETITPIGDLALCAQWAKVIDVSQDGVNLPDGVSYNNNVFTIKDDGEYTVINATTTNRIVVASGVTATVTLRNATINVNSCAFDMAGANVTLVLKKTNTLKSGPDIAGLHVPSDATLTIDGFTGGKLIATGGNGKNGSGAGIGGSGYSEAGGKVTINSGTVEATGGTNNGDGAGGSAGIGGAGGQQIHHRGGAGGAGGVVTINGGTVTAKGGTTVKWGGGGAGIGGGGGGDDGGSSGAGGAGGAGGTVIINGGSVTATGGAYNSGGGGAGIGGGGGCDGGAGGVAAIYSGPGDSEDTTSQTYDSGAGDPRVIANGGNGSNNGQAIGAGGNG